MSITKKTTNHPFQRLIPDCCSVIFQYYIHPVNRQDVEFTKEDVAFFQAFILSWKLRNYQSDVNEFLRMTQGRKPALFHVDVFLHDKLQPDAFKLFEGITSIDMSHSTSPSETHHTDHVMKHLRGVQHLDIGDCQGLTSKALEYVTSPSSSLKSLRMTLCKSITDEAFPHLRGLKKLEASRCCAITKAALSHLSGIEHLDISFCEKILFDANDLDMISDVLAVCRVLKVDKGRFLGEDVKKAVVDIIQAHGGTVELVRI
uniref:Uncharacterized protein n=1 Tax=Percolomonas cosmopolitus TaxID=63605 RepID=A0A7S1PFM7_9EUKA